MSRNLIPDPFVVARGVKISRKGTRRSLPPAGRGGLADVRDEVDKNARVQPRIEDQATG